MGGDGVNADAAAPGVADSRGALPLPWLAQPLADTLASHRGHALLVQAQPGIGAMAFALTLAQAWLCEAADAGVLPQAPCGHCGSCRLVQSHVHPDLTVLLPETLRRAHGWPLADDKPDAEDGKRKPSRQIRIPEVRMLIDRTTRTSARGRGKVAVLHPADALNGPAANALLKTLEEPPAGTRLLLTTADPALLLPTVRSRCQHMRLAAPDSATAVAWLAAQGLSSAAEAHTLLAASGGRPLDALALRQAGVDGAAWAALPQAVAQGHAAALAGWPVPQAVDALQKLCHDALARACGGPARYFADDCVPRHGQPDRLSAWARELGRVARHDSHPWHEALLLESLISSGAHALAPSPGAHGVRAAGPGTAGPAQAFDTLR